MKLLLLFVGVVLGVGLSSSLHWFSPHRIAGKDHIKDFPIRLVEPVPLQAEESQQTVDDGDEEPISVHDLQAAIKRVLNEGDDASAEETSSVAPAQPPLPPPAVEEAVVDTRIYTGPKEKTYWIDNGVVRPKLLAHVMYARTVTRRGVPTAALRRCCANIYLAYHTH